MSSEPPRRDRPSAAPGADSGEQRVRFVSFPCTYCGRRIEHRGLDDAIPCRSCGRSNRPPVPE